MSVCAANYHLEVYYHVFPSTQYSPRELLERPGRSQVENTKAPSRWVGLQGWENLEAVWPQYEIGHILTRGNIALQKTENQHCKLMSVCAANYYIENYCHVFPSTQNSPRKLLERPGRSQVENTKAPKIPRPTKALTVGTGRVGQTVAQAIMLHRPCI